jgi:hypothetical protein
MVWIVILVAVVAVLAAVLWFVLTRQHPEQADSHAGDRRDVDAMGRGNGSPGVVGRPAGADAENMAPDPDPRPSPPD